ALRAFVFSFAHTRAFVGTVSGAGKLFSGGPLSAFGASADGLEGGDSCFRRPNNDISPFPTPLNAFLAAFPAVFTTNCPTVLPSASSWGELTSASALWAT